MERAIWGRCIRWKKVSLEVIVALRRCCVVYNLFLVVV